MANGHQDVGLDAQGQTLTTEHSKPSLVFPFTKPPGGMEVRGKLSAPLEKPLNTSLSNHWGDLLLSRYGSLHRIMASSYF